MGLLAAVDVHQLAAQRDGGLQGGAGKAHAVPDLQGTRLDSGPPWRSGDGPHPVDKTEAHSVATQRGDNAQLDRASTREQYVEWVSVRHGQRPVTAPDHTAGGCPPLALPLTPERRGTGPRLSPVDARGAGLRPCGNRLPASG